MRSLLALALLLATVSCVAPPPAPALTTAPPPSPPVAAGPVFTLPNPLAWLYGPPPPPAARLTLSNFGVDDVRVQAVITPFPDCTVHDGTSTSDFVLPRNGTRIIEAAAGSDVCWRRAAEPAKPPETAASMSGWTEWNRVFLSSGRSIDSRL